ncbi:biotin/lipoyl-binding protein [Desulforamulus hydrothermalis]|nr:biotin/lipoyl-binding protein [Desulforamulus hydrothermalis]SHH23446.1 Biotin-lipoyl like [Desulforamulus hydrothermalis Lam5 = DSM 18033]
MKIKAAQNLGLHMLTRLKTPKGGLLVLFLLVVLSGIVFRFYQQRDAKTEITYQRARVQRDDIVVGFDSDGSVDFSKVTLRFDVKGTIAEVLVSEGDAVKKGQVIARLDDRDYQDQYGWLWPNCKRLQKMILPVCWTAN